MEVLECCALFCVVHCRVRCKSIFDQRRATPVRMCQVILTAPDQRTQLSDGTNNRECDKKMCGKEDRRL